MCQYLKMNMSIWCYFSRFGIQKPFLDVSAGQWQVEMSWEHEHDLLSQGPGVWELCWWKGNYICTQSPASLAVALHWVSPIIPALSRRPESWEVRGQSGCWAADSIPIAHSAHWKARTGLSGRILNLKLVGGEWERSLWDRSNPTSFCYNRSFPLASLPPSCTVPHPHDPLSVMEAENYDR